MKRACFIGMVVVVGVVGACTTQSEAQTESRGVVRPLDPPADRGAMAPKLTTAGKSLLLSWLEPVSVESGIPDAPRRDHHEVYRLRFCRLDEGIWSQPRTVIERDDFFANWADVPSVTQAADGALVAHWLQKSAESAYAYDVMLARSQDDGATWRVIGQAHDDGTKTEHGFVSSVAESEGVRLFWLDGREMAPDEHGHGRGSMTLRTAVLHDSVRNSLVLDPRICECCPTDAAMTAKGPVVVYRDLAGGDERDIAIVRSTDGKWTDPQPVHADGWQIAGCPVNGPAIAARGNLVAVAWFTAAQHTPRVLIAFSSDAGAHFGHPVEIDGEEPHGRVDLVMDEEGRAIVCWLADAGEHALLRLRRVRPDGALEEPIAIAETSAARGSGFPTMARINPRTLVVWTDVNEPKRLRAVLVDH